MYESSLLLKLIAKYEDAGMGQAITDQERLEDAIRGAYLVMRDWDKSLSQTEIELDKMDDATRSLMEAFKLEELEGFERGLEQAADELETLIATFREGETAVSMLESELSTIEDELADVRRAAELADQGMTGLEDEITTLARETGQYESSVIRATEATGDYTDMAERKSRINRNLAQEEREAAAAVEDMAQASGRAERELRDFDQTTDRAVSAQRRLEGEMRDTTEAAERQGSAWGRLSEKMGGFTKYLGASIVGSLTFAFFNKLEDGLRMTWEFVKESEIAFAEYDNLVRRTFAQAPDTTFGFDELASKARTTGIELGYLPEEVIPSVRKALNLGIDESNIFTSIEDAAKSARVSGAELEETMVSAVATAKAYGLEMYDIGEILDIFTTITNNSVLEQGDLNTGLAEIINTGAQAGVSLEEVAAAMITMSNQGDSMREITELLSNLFVQISVSGTALGGAFEDAAGVNWQEFVSGGGTLVEALAILEEQADSTGTTLANMIGGESKFYRDQRAALAVLELTNQHADDLRENAQKTADSAGALDTAYKNMAGSTQVLLDRTESAKSSFQTYVGEALEPTTVAYNNLKLAAYEAGIEILKGIITKEARYEEVQTAIEETTESVEALRDAYYDLAVSGGRFDAIQAEIERKYKPDETFNAEDIRDYATAMGVLVDIMKGGQDVTDSQIWTQIAQAVGDVAPAVDIADKAWSDYIVDVELAISSTERARQELESMMQTAENFQTVIGAVFDADTFEAYIDGEITQVRLAGVDAPETGADWEEFYLDIFGFDVGAAATQLTRDLILDGAVTLGPEMAESFDRSVREVFVDNQRLSVILAEAGLAIPMTFGIDDPDTKRQIYAAFEEAAAAGKGIFADADIAAGFLDGSITSLDQLKDKWIENKEYAAEALAAMQEAYELALETTREYVEAFTSDDSILTDVLEARDTPITEDFSAADQAQAEAEALLELELAYLDMGAAAYSSNTISKESAVEVYDALGLIVGAEKELRLEYAFMATEMEAAGQAMATMGIDADIAATALIGLRDGLYGNADAAIAAAEANQVYADSVARVGDTDLADKLTMQELREGDQAMTVVAELDADPTAYNDTMDTVRADAKAFDDESYAAGADLDPELYTTAMELVRTDLAAFDSEVYSAQVDLTGDDAVLASLNALREAALAYAVDYHAYVYTHNVTVEEGAEESTEGSSISGGAIHKSGYYYVGEDGPERVWLNRGDYVQANRDLASSPNISISTVIRGGAASDAQRWSKSMIRDLRKAKLL